MAAEPGETIPRCLSLGDKLFRLCQYYRLSCADYPG